MAQKKQSRTMRDATLTIQDGSGTPQTVQIMCGDGDFSWVEMDEFVQIPERGRIDVAGGGHVRSGNQNACTFSLTARWPALYGAASGPEQLYEFINRRSGMGVTSTAPTGWPPALTLIYAGTKQDGTTETITFLYCYFEEKNPQEAGDGNTISLSGFDFEQQPTIT